MNHPFLVAPLALLLACSSSAAEKTRSSATNSLGAVTTRGAVPVSPPIDEFLEVHPRSEVEDAFRTYAKRPTQKTFESLLSVLPHHGDLYVLEGDLLMTREDVRWHLGRLEKTPVATLDYAARKLDDKLLANKPGKKWSFWDWSHRHLTYSVNKSSFAGNDARYARVVREIAAAAKDWAEVCPSCNLTFEHLPRDEQANLEPGGDLTFVVEYDRTRSSVLASAFSPDQPARRFRVMDRWFRETKASTGILRHELGHILGYRHEYIDSPSACASEDGSWERLTEPDSESVMHFFCGRGTSEMRLSDRDREGHTRLYQWRWAGPGGGLND